MGEEEAFFCRQVAKTCDLPEDRGTYLIDNLLDRIHFIIVSR